MPLIRLTATDLSDMNEVQHIYETALPPSERKSRDEIHALLERPDYAIVAAKAGTLVTGFSIIYRSEHQPVGLLEYMATRPEYRNNGLGQLLFRNALELMGRRIMLVEVEAVTGSGKERSLQLRRQRYYMRLGCILIEGLPYRMPQLNEHAPPPLSLMLHPGRQRFSLSEQILQRWISTIYSDVYGYDGHEDQIDKMIAAWRTATASTGSSIG